MREKDITSIGDIYGSMLNSVKTIKESKEPKTFDGEFRNKKDKDGPENADGYNKLDNKVEEEDEEDDVSKYLPKKKKEFGRKDEDEEIDGPEEDEEVDSEDEDEEKPVGDREGTLTNRFREERLEKEKKDSGRWAKSKKDMDDWKKSNEEDEEILESKKIATKTLNKHMSKSAFDQLFNKVLKENFGQPQEGDDIDALGLDDSTPDADLGDDFGGEDEFGGEEDSVTFTLDRATAQTLIDVLQGALGGEDEGEGEDDLDFGGEDEFGGEDDGLDFEEDEEVQGTKVAPDKKAAFQAKSNKVGGKANPKGSGKAKTDVTDETGTKDGAPPINALQGKSNQVPGSTLKAKAEYFK